MIDITLLAGNLSRLSYCKVLYRFRMTPYITRLQNVLFSNLVRRQESASQNQAFAACSINVEVGICMEDTIPLMVGFHLFVTDSAQLVLWGSS